MKPLLIKLRNIGPFVNEQIDFSKLENMFLFSKFFFKKCLIISETLHTFEVHFFVTLWTTHCILSTATR